MENLTPKERAEELNAQIQKEFPDSDYIKNCRIANFVCYTMLKETLKQHTQETDELNSFYDKVRDEGMSIMSQKHDEFMDNLQRERALKNQKVNN